VNEVERYAWVDRDEWLSAACFTAVRGVATEEDPAVVRRGLRAWWRRFSGKE
jgi:hypothetical protein